MLPIPKRHGKNYYYCNIYFSNAEKEYYVGYGCGPLTTTTKKCSMDTAATEASALGENCETTAGCPSTGSFNVTRCYCDKDNCNFAVHFAPSAIAISFSVISLISHFMFG